MKSGAGGGGAIAVGWVKSQIMVYGNEIADGMAKKGAQKRVDVLQVTEGGIRQKIKKWKREVRQVKGFGKRKVMSWARRTATNYSQLRTNKGALQAWRYKIGKAESPECRQCGKAAESGDHLVFVYEEWRELRKEVWVQEEEATARRWRDWKDLDSGNWAIKERDAQGKLVVRDLVAEFMSKSKLR